MSGNEAIQVGVEKVRCVLWQTTAQVKQFARKKRTSDAKESEGELD